MFQQLFKQQAYCNNLPKIFKSSTTLTPIFELLRKREFLRRNLKILEELV